MCQAFALRLDHEAKEEKDRPEELVWKRTEKIIKSGLERFSEEWILYWHDCFLYGVMNYDARQVEEVRKMMRDCLNQLEAAKHLIGVRVFSLGLGEAKDLAGIAGFDGGGAFGRAGALFVRKRNPA